MSIDPSSPWNAALWDRACSSSCQARSRRPADPFCRAHRKLMPKACTGCGCSDVALEPLPGCAVVLMYCALCMAEGRLDDDYYDDSDYGGP
jgi:hypothetical protein